MSHFAIYIETVNSLIARNLSPYRTNVCVSNIIHASSEIATEVTVQSMQLCIVRTRN